MKSFKQLTNKRLTDLINEATYIRFLRNNDNLSTNQIKELDNYYTNINPQAGSKIDWQSKKVKKWTYNDFLDDISQYKSGRKVNMKCSTKLKGLKAGEDFVHIKLKIKKYCAYIPLNWKTAKKFNTDKIIGACSGDWCIGSTISKQKWDDYVLLDKQVPIYIVNNETKWVVMIKESNLNFDIWDIKNLNPKPDNIIPDFNIRKELLTPKLKKLYNNIRDEFYQENPLASQEVIEQYSMLKNFIAGEIAEPEEDSRSVYRRIIDGYQSYKLFLSRNNIYDIGDSTVDLAKAVINYNNPLIIYVLDAFPIATEIMNRYGFIDPSTIE